MERAGTGIKRIENYCKLNRNKVKFDFDEFFFVKIYSNLDKLEGVNEGVNELYNYILKNPGKRINYISKELNIPNKTLKRWISILKKKRIYRIYRNS